MYSEVVMSCNDQMVGILALQVVSTLGHAVAGLLNGFALECLPFVNVSGPFLFYNYL